MPRHLLAISLLLVLGGCQTRPADPSTFGKADIFGEGPLHISGFDFPAHIDGFRRVSLTEYDKAEDDFSVGYRHGHDALATVVIYPANGHSLESEFAGCMNALQQRHPDANHLGNDSVALGAQAVLARRASYRYSEFAGVNRADWRVDLLLMRRGGEFVELRLSWPADSALGPAAVGRFAQDFVWPSA